uniref:Titin n=1 Tax=Mastacembelus armatus TaxID=205130 RepID=A0A7N8WKS1_9TELE
MVEPKIQAISYKVTKLLPGNEYIFRVTAVNKYGVGEPLESEPVTARNPFTTPSAPSTPEASAVTRDTIVLTWERPEDNGGAEIEGYILEKRDKDGIRWTKCNKKRLTDLRFRCTGLTEGHSYEFRVSAENAAGVGKPSAPTQYIKACDATYPPGPPNNPKVTDHSSTTVSLSWSRPIYDGGAQISGYVVEMKEAADDEWVVCTPPTGVQSTHYTVKKLKENAEYNFRICAVNSEGVGEPVDLPVSVIAAEKLEAPEIELDADLRKMVTVRATATLRLFVTIRGRPEPEVRWSKADGTLNERALIEVTSSYTMLVIENVDRFDTGKYVLTLENLSGSKSAFISVRVLDSPSAPTNLEVKDVKRNSVSLSWEPPLIDGGAKISHYIVEKREQKRMAFTNVCLPASTDQVKVSEAPLPPGKVVLVDVTRHSVTLSWEKPDHDGGSKIINYIVEMQPKGDDKWSVCSEVKALEATIEGLTTEEEYSFRVIAVNDKGKSDAKPLVTPVMVKDITMEPIINLLFNTYSVKAGDDLKIDVPFKGRPQPEVSWKKDGQVLKQTTRVNVLTCQTSSKIIIKDATREDVGKYEIALTNSVGTKTAEIFVIILDKPGPPSNIKVDEVSADFISLSWDPPAYDGGCQINNYVVEKRDTTTTTWQIVSATVARTSIKVCHLTQGTEYQGVNKYGEGEALESEPTKAMDPFTVPAAPTNVQVTSVTSEAMTICWERPVSDGGSSISGYVIEKREKTGLRWCRVNKKPVYDLRVKASHLREGFEYEYRVFAENAAGLSAPSIPCPLTKAEDPQFLPSPPAKPKIVDSTKTTVTLSWNKPLFDGGAPVIGYKVEYRNTLDDEWIVGVQKTKNTEFTVVGLTPGVEYVFVVKSINKIGVSDPSPESDKQVAKEREEEPTFDISNEMRKTLIVKDGSSFTITVPFRGKPIPSVTWTKTDVDLRVRAVIDTTDTFTSITLEKATRNDSGKYTLTLSNIAGTSSLTLNVRVLDSPGPPLGVTDVTKESVSLAWAKPEQDGGSRITGYMVEALEKGQEKWVKCGVTKFIHFTVSGLRENTEYFFRVRAENHAGLSDAKEMVIPVLVKNESPEIIMKDFPHHTVYVRAGSTLKCEIPLTGRPLPKVTLSKDNVLLKSTMRFNSEVTPDMEEFKYLGVLFRSEARMECKIDRWVRAVAAAMHLMYPPVMVMKELSQKAKFSIYQSIYVPTLTYGHEL